MDIKTRLTRCCGKDMGSGLTCHDGMRCPDCFDKLEGWREIEFWRNRTKSEEIQVKYWNERANKRSEIILEQQEEIERLRKALRDINRKNDNPSRFNIEIHEILEAALQQNGSE